MKDPAFLFYPNDFMGGTMGMSFEEKGAYIELLVLQFNRGHMTSHMIGQTVGQLWSQLKDKFKEDDEGLFYNERLDIEINKRKSFVTSRKNNLLGKNQHLKEEESCIHMDAHMTSHMENENENRNNKTKEEKLKLLETREVKFKSEVYAFMEKYSNTMLSKFCNYWTEKNASQTKMKFELEKTFEISKRLATWASRDKTFTKEPETPHFGTSEKVNYATIK